MVLGHPFLENSVPHFGPSVSERCALCCHLAAVPSQGQAPLPSQALPTHPAALPGGLIHRAQALRLTSLFKPAVSYLLFPDCFPTVTNSENRKHQEGERKEAGSRGEGLEKSNSPSLRWVEGG